MILPPEREDPLFGNYDGDDSLSDDNDDQDDSVDGRATMEMGGVSSADSEAPEDLPGNQIAWKINKKDGVYSSSSNVAVPFPSFGEVSSFYLGREVGTSNGIVIQGDIDELGISRIHLKISMYRENIDPGNLGSDIVVEITDMGSSNGTFINGSRLSSDKPYKFEGHETVTIGRMGLVLMRSDMKQELRFDVQPRAVD